MRKSSFSGRGRWYGAGGRKFMHGKVKDENVGDIMLMGVGCGRA